MHFLQIGIESVLRIATAIILKCNNFVFGYMFSIKFRITILLAAIFINTISQMNNRLQIRLFRQCGIDIKLATRITATTHHPKT